MTPAKVVEFDVPATSVLLPRITKLPATPSRSRTILLPELVAEMSNVAPAPARLRPLDAAMLPWKLSNSAALAPTVVAPV